MGKHNDWDDDNEGHNIADERRSFSDILKGLQNPVVGQHPQQRNNDPKSIRLAAVTCAVLDIANATTTSSDTIAEPTAAQVYAKAVTALEGTLKRSDHEKIADSFATTSALLELLHVTIPYVTPPAILAHTLQPLTSRVLRAVVATANSVSSVDDTLANGGAGANAVLRASCRVATVLLQALPGSTDEKAVQQFLTGTLLTIFNDARPKVRKAAHHGVLEILLDQEKSPHKSVMRTLNTYILNEFNIVTSHGDSALQKILHLLPFVERSIFHLNYERIGDEVMTFLSTLIQQQSKTNDYVTIKIQESTPKILTVASLLAIVLVMLTDEDHTEYTKKFSQRVLASLLQVKSFFIVSATNVEFEISEKTKILYGQVIIAASIHVVDTDTELACKLLPLAIQAVVQLSKPGDPNPNDATIAQTLFMELTQFVRTSIPLLMRHEQDRTNDTVTLEKCLQDILQCLVATAMLDPIYRPTWSIALPMIARTIQQVNTIVDVRSSIESLIQLHNTTPRALKHVVEDAVSILVQSVGIEMCWKWINWQEDSSTKSKGRISLFIVYFIYAPCLWALHLTVFVVPLSCFAQVSHWKEPGF
jgi:hypothetical protein